MELDPEWWEDYTYVCDNCFIYLTEDKNVLIRKNNQFCSIECEQLWEVESLPRPLN